MNDDVYYPQQINDNPFSEDGEVTYANNNGSNPNGKEVVTPLKDVDKKFPPKNISHETISESLNTRTKKIKAEYSFAKHGALSIGEYVDGVSGEVKISPNGITAKNINGEETFAIDGTSGDATFKGVLQAGSLIAGDGEIIIGTYEGRGQILFMEEDKAAVLLGWGDFG